MWIVKVQEIVERQDGSQENNIVSFIECKSLRDAYRVAMMECKNIGCAIASFYRGGLREGALEESAASEYQISKGLLGGIIVWGRNHKKLCTVRENREILKHSA